MIPNEYNVLKGAESFYIKGNNTGILLLHGFVGTPQSVQYIGEKYAEKGLTVLAPRLKGHGTHYTDLNTISYYEWINECIDAYNTLKKECDQVFIIGQSMGGILALHLASILKDVSGVITINAAIHVPGYEIYRGAESPRYIHEGTPDIKDQAVNEITYEQVPLHSIKQLLSVIDHTKKTLYQVTCPLLLFKSSIDHVVPPISTDFIYDSVQSQHKMIKILNNSYHVASMDYDKNIIINHTIDFITDVKSQKQKYKLLQ
ncbi:alpha/beta hydrolase [Bacillus sp. Marseille-P3661]|uniref:alpha/beta hydrolase n=1 Tax=Bacillus sp. Marseille-P3661 TaxID=1936234 RepID=UPI000C83CB45|nr:alpha/beta fold hydrolase [Bacillus sp. Marseille-P3661]